MTENDAIYTIPYYNRLTLSYSYGFNGDWAREKTCHAYAKKNQCTQIAYAGFASI